MFTKLTISCICLTLCFATLLFPQRSVAQVSLIGKWDVACAVEKTSEDAVTVCDICQKVSNTKSSLSIGDLNFAFTNDSLTIGKEQEKKKSTVKYTLLDKLQVLQFMYEGVSYSFNILVTRPGEYILKEQTNGCILQMKKSATK